jgi:signal transduction histidine kinase
MMDLEVPTAARVHNDAVQSVVSTQPPAATMSDFPLAMTAASGDATQQRTAFGAIIVVLLVGAAAVPFAHSTAIRPGPVIAVMQTTLALVDLITAVLLFSQYSIEPSRGVLAAAAGFIFSAFFAFGQTLALPGLYAATAAIGDGSNTAAWLFVLWHVSFPLAMIFYGLSRRQETSDRRDADRRPATSILITATVAPAATVLLTWLVSVGSPYLPDLYAGSAQVTVAAKSVHVGLCLIYGAAVLVLCVRGQSLLDLWLIVILLAWWPHLLVAGFSAVTRFDVGWYLVRGVAVLASSALLLVLLAQITALYARIAGAILLLRRDRADRLASVEAATAAVAHEMMQPLAGIASSAAAGLNWLKKNPAVVDKAATCFASIISTSHRAEEIISRIHGALKRPPKQRTKLQLVELCREVMRLIQYDILANGISATLDCRRNVPEILADAAQLRLAILNLVKNGIDAMSDSAIRDRHLRLAIRQEGASSIVLCIEDTGPGIPAEVQGRLFEPFVTTKSAMGVGLVTCRAIVEDHGGTLRLCRSDAQGCVFEMTLPVGSVNGQP